MSSTARPSSRDPLSDFDLLEAELGAYAQQLDPAEGGIPLMERPRLVVLNKIDVPDGRELAEFVRDDLRSRGLPTHLVSAASREGLRELSFALASAVAEAREAVPAPAAAPRLSPRPRARREDGFTVSRRSQGGQEFYLVRGGKPERWIRQTDFDNDEAVGYLADRLNALGVEDALVEAGARAGDTVVIGPEDSGVIFDWEPTMRTGAELLGPRGTDLRLDEGRRSSRKERKAAYHERMDAKADAREGLWMDRQAGLWVDPAEEG